MIVDQKLNKQFVGVYLIDGIVDGTQLATTSKPTWFKRVMTKWLIGWEWVDIPHLKAEQDALKAAKILLQEENKEVK
jgi:hypothetical protein